MRSRVQSQPGCWVAGRGFWASPKTAARSSRACSSGTAAVPSSQDDTAGWDELGRVAVREARAAYVPGLGHPVHKVEDPRTPRLMAIAEEAGALGPHLRLFGAIGRVHEEILGRHLPLNGAGVCGAALATSASTRHARGVALLARTAGLLGQLAEEQRRPSA